MDKRKKILISAYACKPNSGSEPGVGWNVPVTLASRHQELDVYVLTQSKRKEQVEEELRNKSLGNLHFLYYSIPHWLIIKNKALSKWSEQYNYLMWQLFAQRYVKRMCKQLKIDVFHHLTFNQYRTPSPGFWLDIPFVMGPVGGAETIAPAFWQDLGENTKKRERIRLKGKDLQLFKWLCKRKNNKKTILCSCKANEKRLCNVVDSRILSTFPAIGFNKKDFVLKGKAKERSNTFEMLYAGRIPDWKGVHIFLRAVSKAFTSIDDYRVQIVGVRSEEEQQRVQMWANELGIQEKIKLTPFIQRNELLKMETEIDLSVYPAFRDSGSMSVLETCAMGCATICFDTGGQDCFPDDILLKVSVADAYDEILDAFSEKLRWAYEHRDKLKTIGLRAKEWVTNNLTWENKVDEFARIYNEITAE